MSLDKLKRVIWRLQEMKTGTSGCHTNTQIRRAIMEEIGTDERTIRVTIIRMKELGLLRSTGFGMMEIDRKEAV